MISIRDMQPATSSVARADLAELLVEYGVNRGDAQAIAGCAESANLLREEAPA